MTLTSSVTLYIIVHLLVNGIASCFKDIMKDCTLRLHWVFQISVYNVVICCLHFRTHIYLVKLLGAWKWSELCKKKYKTFLLMNIVLICLKMLNMVPLNFKLFHPNCINLLINSNWDFLSNNLLIHIIQVDGTLRKVDASKTTPSDHDSAHVTPADESMSSEAKRWCVWEMYSNFFN